MPELLSTSKEPLMPNNNVTDLITDQEKEKQRRQEERRDQVLDRLWEIAGLSPEMTRGSITGQVKAIQMIVAIEGMIPDGRAGSAKKNSVPASIYPQPSPVRQENDFAVPEPEATPGSAEDVPRDPVPSQSAFANRFTPSQAPEPYVSKTTGLPTAAEL